VVVTVVAVRVVQPAVDQIVDVVAVWDGFVATAGPMEVMAVVPLGDRLVLGGILRRDFKPVFFDGAVFARVMEVAIMQIVDVVFVFDGGVLAVGSVNVGVILVDFTHRDLLKNRRLASACRRGN
jgi:hypothetical protein